MNSTYMGYIRSFERKTGGHLTRSRVGIDNLDSGALTRVGGSKNLRPHPEDKEPSRRGTSVDFKIQPKFLVDVRTLREKYENRQPLHDEKVRNKTVSMIEPIYLRATEQINEVDSVKHMSIHTRESKRTTNIHSLPSKERCAVGRPVPMTEFLPEQSCVKQMYDIKGVKGKSGSSHPTSKQPFDRKSGGIGMKSVSKIGPIFIKAKEGYEPHVIKHSKYNQSPDTVDSRGTISRESYVDCPFSEPTKVLHPKRQSGATVHTAIKRPLEREYIGRSTSQGLKDLPPLSIDVKSLKEKFEKSGQSTKEPLQKSFSDVDKISNYSRDDVKGLRYPTHSTFLDKKYSHGTREHGSEVVLTSLAGVRTQNYKKQLSRSPTSKGTLDWNHNGRATEQGFKVDINNFKQDYKVQMSTQSTVRLPLKKKDNTYVSEQSLKLKPTLIADIRNLKQKYEPQTQPTMRDTIQGENNFIKVKPTLISNVKSLKQNYETQVFKQSTSKQSLKKEVSDIATEEHLESKSTFIADTRSLKQAQESKRSNSNQSLESKDSDSTSEESVEVESIPIADVRSLKLKYEAQVSMQATSRQSEGDDNVTEEHVDLKSTFVADVRNLKQKYETQTSRQALDREESEIVSEDLEDVRSLKQRYESHVSSQPTSRHSFQEENDDYLFEESLEMEPTLISNVKSLKQKYESQVSRQRTGSQSFDIEEIGSVSEGSLENEPTCVPDITSITQVSNQYIRSQSLERDDIDSLFEQLLEMESLYIGDVSSLKQRYERQTSTQPSVGHRLERQDRVSVSEENLEPEPTLKIDVRSLKRKYEKQTSGQREYYDNIDEQNLDTEPTDVKSLKQKYERQVSGQNTRKQTLEESLREKRFSTDVRSLKQKFERQTSRRGEGSSSPTEKRFSADVRQLMQMYERQGLRHPRGVQTVH